MSFPMSITGRPDAVRYGDASTLDLKADDAEARDDNNEVDLAKLPGP